MTTHICDKCGADITNSKSASVGTFGASAELCVNCFLPYLRRLRRDKISPKALVRIEERLKNS